MTSDVPAIPKSHSLAEVLRSIESVLKKTYAKPYWVRCEISRIGVHSQSGHSYLELVEKNDKGIIAQVKAMIWSDKYTMICRKFENVTGTKPGNGMQVMLLCSVSFHPVHGLSLMITDIEPSFTLGEMARMKNEAIARLKQEGLMEKNKQLSFPALPSRLAIISVDTSRGYQDFIQTIQTHPKHYRISWTLFEAILQGENAVPTIMAALKKIVQQSASFDAIAIIRGGAGETGLACYDDFLLSKTIATFPLPVLTGIGHATNQTVVEMVAHRSFITPTAAAQFLLGRFEEEEYNLVELQRILYEDTLFFLQNANKDLVTQAEKFKLSVKAGVSNEQSRLENQIQKIKLQSRHYLTLQNNELNRGIHELQFKSSHFYFARHEQTIQNEAERIIRNTEKLLSNQNTLVDMAVSVLKQVVKPLREMSISVIHLEEKINLLSPAQTLKRGYSITRHAGKAITDSAQLHEGDQIEIEFAQGKISTKL